MPFTFAHPAAVLPFARSKRLSFIGLVIGAMCPDFEYFLTLRLQGIHGHSFWGLFYFDLPLGIVATGLFVAWMRNPTLRYAPAFLQRRFAADYLADYSVSLWWLAFSVLIGAATHVLWDGFTHAGRFAQWLPLLERPSWFGGRWPWYRVLQHSSTLLGICAISAYVYWRPQQESLPLRMVSWRAKVRFWGAVILLAAALVVVRLIWLSAFPSLGNGVVLLISVGWWSWLTVSWFDAVRQKDNNTVSFGFIRLR